MQEFKSQLFHLPTTCPWENLSSSLYLQSLIIKWERQYLPDRAVMRVKGDKAQN